MSENYIRTQDSVLEGNAHTLSLAKENGLDYILIDGKYNIDMELL